MMLYLNTQFSEGETRILAQFTQRHNMELSIVYAVDRGSIKGVDNPRRMIAVGGLYLCESADEPLTWYMGDKMMGQYGFWGNYGNLLDALEGL